jgi:2-dehydro-3-deoxygluconokinase
MKVKDTTGAGDCFNGVYLAHRLAGEPPVAAAQAALAAAAVKVSWPGAITPRRAKEPRR